MKSQKGFIQIPLLIAIIAGVLVLGSGGYFGIKQYQNYQTEKIEQKKQEETTRKAEEEQRQKLQELLESQGKALEDQKTEIETLKNRKPETNTQTIIKEVPAQPPKLGNDLPSIIQHWQPVITYIECDYPVVDTYGNFQYQQTVSGSALAVYVQSTDQYTLWTNKHVTAHSGGKLCRIIFPDSNSPLISIKARVGSNSNEDFAVVDIPKPNEQIQNTIKNVVNTSPFLCSQKPSIGDEIVILGYPGIGSHTDITATEGIISGFDGNYFITSAKIEQGNSGGVAILLKDNCYLGIPSFSQLGVIESLGRILDWHNFFK